MFLVYLEMMRSSEDGMFKRLVAILVVGLCVNVACTSPAQGRSAVQSQRGTALATPSASATPGGLPSPTPQPPDTPTAVSGVDVAAIQLLSPKVGFATAFFGPPFGLLKTTDGGGTWRRLGTPASHIESIRFIDEDIGWLVGSIVREGTSLSCQQAAPVSVPACRGVVLRTQDGGRTWETLLSVPSDFVAGNPVRQLQAVDGQRAWVLVKVASGCDGYGCGELRGTIDGGRTWTKLGGANIIAIRFASAAQGWMASQEAGGPVAISSTSDGGRTWTNRFVTGARRLVDLDAASTSTAWVLTVDPLSCTGSSCLNYELLRTTDSGQSWHHLGNPKSGTGACTIGQLDGPFFASPQRGWLPINRGAGGAVVEAGHLATEDGGLTWSCAATPANTVLASPADPQHWWITAWGAHGTVASIYSTSDGGAHFELLRLDVP